VSPTFVAYLNIVASLATLLALALAASQLRSARAQTRSLETIFSSLSTRYIGDFPGYLSAIADEIDKAEKSVSIFCDFPAYGCFSDPDKWLKYRFAIGRKMAQSVSVEFTCLDRQGRKRFSPEQFEKPNGQWDKWKEERREQLERFLRAHKPKLALGELSKDQFLEILESVNLLMLEDTFAPAIKHQVRMDMPIYFWIIDSRVAFFAFRYSNKNLECGFSTLDPKLIGSFLQMQAFFHEFLSSEEGDSKP
jgi:hypothetical protein